MKIINKFFTLLLLIVTSKAYAAVIDFSEVIEKVQDAVVEINVMQRVNVSNKEFNSNDLGEILKYFFENNRPPKQESEKKLGTGFFISEDGLLVTNHHIVENSENIEIIYKQEKLKAKIIGMHKETDLAVLKVEHNEKFNFLEFADSANISVGDPIAVIGNPLGMGISVTSGIISAISKNIGYGPYDNFLQIDAPINAGNSGGPVIDISGKVVGISSMYVYSVGVSGMGFAISANLAKIVTDQLISKGYFNRGYMGVKVQDITDAISNSYQKNKGVLVAEVEEDGPAMNAGVKVGDLILFFNGQRINNINELNRKILYDSKSNNAEIEVLRPHHNKFERLKFSMIMDNKDEEVNKIAALDNKNKCPDRSLEIIPNVCFKNIHDLEPQIKQKYHIKNKEGIIVYHILDKKIISDNYLMPGDIINNYMEKKINKLSDLKKIVNEVNKNQDFITLMIHRNENTLFVGLSLK